MQRMGGTLVTSVARTFEMPSLDEMADTEHLREIRELLRFLLAPRPLEEELGGIQGRELGSRRKPVHGPPRTSAAGLAR
jgi:hypothetical protein